MDGLLIGYARVSTDAQDLTAQHDALTALGVHPDRIYVDHGLTGTNRDRPGLREALAACRAGDTLVVTKLDRLARSLPDARGLADELTARAIRLSLNGSVHDPTDPVGRLLFNVLAMVAEFEADLIRMRTREGMAVARAKGWLRGKQPKLTARQEAHLVALHHAGGHTAAELAELFAVARSTRLPRHPTRPHDHRPRPRPLTADERRCHAGARFPLTSTWDFSPGQLGGRRVGRFGRNHRPTSSATAADVEARWAAPANQRAYLVPAWAQRAGSCSGVEVTDTSTGATGRLVR